MLNRLRCRVDGVFKILIGDDIFVSYSRSDGATYAAALATLLTELGFSCRLDQWGTEANSEIPRSLKNALRRSAILVLVGSKGAAQSPHVDEEVQIMFGLRRPLVPIVFDGVLLEDGKIVNDGKLARLEDLNQLDREHVTHKALWAAAIQGLSILCEPTHQLELGEPSDLALNRIKSSFTFRTRNQRLRISIVAVSTILLLLVGASVVAGIFANRMRGEARASSAEARAASAIAEQQTTAADSATQRRLQSEREQRITFARELAGASGRVNAKDPTQALLLAIHAVLTTAMHDSVVTRQAVDALSQCTQTIFPNKVLKHPDHVQNALTMGLSPDGRYALLSSSDTWYSSKSKTEFFAWDLDRGTALQELHWSGKAHSFSFAADGKSVLFTGNNGFELDNFPLGRTEWAANAQAPPFFWNGSLQPSGRLAAIGLSNNSIQIWDTQTKKQIASLAGYGSRVEDLQFALNGKLLVATTDRAMKIWNASSHKLLQIIRPPIETGPRIPVWLDNAVLSPSMKVAALTQANLSGISIWSIHNGRPLFEIADDIYMYNLAFTPDGRFLIFAGHNDHSEETLAIWDLDRRKCVVRLKAGKVKALAVSADGRRLVTAGEFYVSLWSLKPLLEWTRGQDDIKRLRALRFSSDGIAAAPAELKKTLALFRELAARNLTDSECAQYHLDQEQCRSIETLPPPRSTATPSETRAAATALIAKARAANVAAQRVDLSEQVLALDPANDEAAGIWLAAVPPVSPVTGLTEPIPLQIVITGLEAYESANEKKMKVTGKVLDKGVPVPGADIRGLTTDEDGNFDCYLTGWQRTELQAFKVVSETVYFGITTIEPPQPRIGK